MKIAHICEYYLPTIGGVTKVVEELSRRQIEDGNEVHVYCSDWDKEKRIKKKEEIIDGVHVHRCPNLLRVGPFATMWPSVFSRILRESFDTIHTHEFGHLHFVLAGMAGKLKGAKHIHTTHCPWTDSFRPVAAEMGILLSYNIFSRIALSRFTDKIVAITPWEYSFIQKYGGRKEKIINIPNGVDDSFFKKVKKNDFKKKLGIKGPLVLFFGRLNVTKGPEKFVEIAHRVLKERPDVTFVIRGPDEGMRETVKRMIGDEKRIILMEETRDRKEIIKMYQSADVFVLPSFREGLPLTLFEAMASGLPIVATPVNGIPYEMKNPENGFLLEYGDNEGFKDKIVQLVDDKKLRERISKNNKARSQEYRWDSIYKKTMAYY